MAHHATMAQFVVGLLIVSSVYTAGMLTQKRPDRDNFRLGWNSSAVVSHGSRGYSVFR